MRRRERRDAISFEVGNAILSPKSETGPARILGSFAGGSPENQAIS
jgi:hypothetical protein